MFQSKIYANMYFSSEGRFCEWFALLLSKGEVDYKMTKN